MNKEETKIGFIGTGVMGKSMALHLIKAGYTVLLFSRTKEKAAPLISQGATWIDSPKELAKQANIVITMVGYPDDVKSIYLGEDGLIENANPHTYLIDMTTSTPTLAKEIAEKAKQKEMYAIDAPVSGGDIGAKNGTLSIMVGGDEAAYQSIFPILQYTGENIVYQGVAGAGQHTKMANQIAIASNMIGVCEAIIYAEKAGLNSENVLRSITSGAAGSWSLSNLVPRMISGDFSPGFYIKHFIKDMTIALDEAEKMGMETPGLSLAKEMYEKLATDGEGESGTQALYKYWER
ncbi:NAD(P)-dependent oxidoreductase [Cytobacillus sp. Sa5YUA1]|uniref:NAD(P)-dependent oxidoreductase n=1 Tax=Cytobacillus stercorigallinarum TaxID=2762240 RepID=A0ABR8QN07_9BACI|nr:NAD(P)-dependent oxidoreductase [Cytobacillus stercorigallinarum]MBD7936913.1 NAD(P)-dependent oxidoreductase [Cytobacillus stercorigallinarum]